ncbi:MAG TPA: T9SS type A sorting domain-containing protein [Catalimonadaceae bacterium]|nr:T9SS type A sorting domain-containing protein [Catalimonadaceae bacterium]
MRIFYTLLMLVSLNLSGQTLQTFHSFKVKDIHSDSISLSSFAGKKLLVVNTASFCGYTYQFAKLQKLDSVYQNYGFRVIGFPCNDFGGQDPYADSTIETFCTNQYAITFPMMSKISIRIGDTSDVYKWLQRKKLNGVSNAQVMWNFNKFLIDEQGHWKRHFLSPTEPSDTAITHWITSSVTGNLPLVKHNSGTLLFKNPVDHQLYLDNLDEGREPSRISLISVEGKVVKSWIYQNGIDHIEESVANLANGIYTMEVIRGNQAERHRIMISK